MGGKSSKNSKPGNNNVYDDIKYQGTSVSSSYVSSTNSMAELLREKRGTTPYMPKYIDDEFSVKVNQTDDEDEKKASNVKYSKLKDDIRQCKNGEKATTPKGTSRVDRLSNFFRRQIKQNNTKVAHQV